MSGQSKVMRESTQLNFTKVADLRTVQTSSSRTECSHQLLLNNKRYMTRNAVQN